ncbi:MAG TPA: amino acid adenylation domain-containing protein, partial [Pyrinomonadaceae bacterium]|nr:amino acid adenylation domain-containing protein [Pyrinomonadaceae bacterium]
ATGTLNTIELAISNELQDKLSQLTKGSPFLSYTIVLAALNVCLHKYTGAETVVVGSPARRREDSDQINALPIVVHIDRQATFKQFLVSLRETLVEAYNHQNYPFKRLIRDLGLNDEETLFDVALIFDEIHSELPDVHHNVTVAFRQTDAGVAGVINYNGDLFSEWTINRFASRLLHVLDAGLSNIETPLGQLSILLDEERQLILHEWNRIPAQYPDQPCLHELFSTQAAKTPGAIALIFEDQEFTYAELDQRANRLANYLINRSLEPGARVGIMIQRSAEMIVGLLGILKAGGVYVPLDPGYPPDRLKYMIDDAAPQIVLTDIAAEVTDESDAAPDLQIDPNAPAYMIYTSGSTGQPKGVVVQHAGVSNLAYAQAIGFRVSEESRCLQFASFSFDTSISDIFTTFAAGAALCVANREQRVSVTALAEFLREKAVTLVTLPPAILALLENVDFPALKTVITAGEACPANVMARWMEGREFFNAYGPTEASVCATYLECTETYQDGPPIGRPWPNMEAYILDEDLQPAPVGLPGELHIGGIGLAHGYLNRAELTAQRFIPHPFSIIPGARLYATGDLARFSPDGLIEFLGRCDQQVKLRGFRIELGEVEAVLASHPHVREVAVLLREDKPGQKQLVAYLAGPGAELKTQGDELRQHLKHWLPEFMVPGQFIWLAEMPLTANGKIDRKQLPAPEDVREGTAQEGYEAPQTTVEELLTQTWIEVLGVERIGRNDNFFELGGHSLLGTQLVSRIRETFDIEIELTSLFESPTVAGLGQLIEAELSEGQGAGLPPLEKANRDAELPLSFAQQRLWFLAQLEPESSVYNISSALRLSGNLSVPVLEQTLSEVLRRHEAFRTTFQTTADGRPVQVIAEPQPATITTNDLGDLSEDFREAEARRLAIEEAHRPFDLKIGPLVR